MKTKRTPALSTLNYTLINVMYFAAYCGVHAYTSVFLLGRGFSNTSIGIILALSNIFSVILQPAVAGYIDKYKKLTNRLVSMSCAAIMILLCISLYFVRGKAVIFVLYALVYTIQMVYQPLIMAMSFEYNSAGDKINFGLARGLGSCGFAVTSVIVGNILVNSDVSVLQIINIISLIVGIFALFIFTKPENDEDKDSEVQFETSALDNGRNNLIGFIKYYPGFMLFVLAGTCMFFAHNALNDYIYQIITPIGGNERIMGYMVMMAAFLELPTMALFSRVEKKVGCKNLLMLSGVMFAVKALIMLLARSIFVAFISQACQMLAYAMFIPGSAYFAEMMMEESDKTKGQAYVNCAITLGGVFSSLVCGRLLDVAGVSTMLLVATIVGAIGAFIAFISLKKCK